VFLAAVCKTVEAKQAGLVSREVQILRSPPRKCVCGEVGTHKGLKNQRRRFDSVRTHQTREERRMKLDPKETIFLTQEEYDRIVEICNNPPAPSAAMVAAARRYKEIFKNETQTSKDS
jgi:hypothetical protein